MAKAPKKAVEAPVKAPKVVKAKAPKKAPSPQKASQAPATKPRLSAQGLEHEKSPEAVSKSTAYDDRRYPNSPGLVVQCAHSEVVDIETLVPHPRNPNKHPDEQIRMLGKIMLYQGWRSPVVVSKRSGFVIKGHGRLQAARLNGWHDAVIDRQDYASEADEYADLVADNRIAELANLDAEILRSIHADMGDGYDFELMGYDALGLTELAAMQVELLGPVEDEDAGEIAVPPVPITQRGDIWVLGAHRVMCGDSAGADIDALMAGGKADLLLTDPPYGVSYADKNAFLNTRDNGKRIQREIERDHQSPAEMQQFWNTVLVNGHRATTDRASYYIFSPQGGELMMMMSIEHAEWQLKHMLIWVKNNHVLGRCDYNYQHEPVFYGWKQNCPHDFYGSAACTSVLFFDKPFKNDLHPTMKPVELCAHLLGNSTQQGGVVLDLFGGSGSTLIAGEQTGRACRLMELDPGYCDVIVARWEKLTGKKAIRA